MEIEWTFKEWLARFTEVDLPIGDLAVDSLRDPCFPATEDYSELHEYYSARGPHVVDAFEPVWQFYIASR